MTENIMPMFDCWKQIIFMGRRGVPSDEAAIGLCLFEATEDFLDRIEHDPNGFKKALTTFDKHLDRIRSQMMQFSKKLSVPQPHKTQ